MVMMNMFIPKYTYAILALAAGLMAPAAALAQDLSAPYNKLNLSPQQHRQIGSLETEWKGRYMDIQPRLQSEQKHLSGLLAQPKSDPLEITSAQQRINQLREQLGGIATTNYLQKRRLLNDQQQNQLEGWLKRKVAERQRIKG